MAATLKHRWENDGATLGLWITSPDTHSAEAVSTLEYDYLNLDLQHGLLDYSSALPVMQTLTGVDPVLTCRVPWNEPGIIGKMLDAGAMGIIVPMVNSVAEAEAAVRSCRYAPAGSRSFGPVRAAGLHDDYYARANDDIACIPMIETAQAVANLDDILDVPGIDAVYVGPADLSISLGLPPASDHDHPDFTGAIEAIVSGCQSRGIVAGIHTHEHLVAKRLEQGFRMITVTSDRIAVGSGAAAALAIARSRDTDDGEGSIY